MQKPNRNKLITRFQRPQTVSSAFGGLMKIFGARASDADLAHRWDEIMGRDIAENAELAGIRTTRDKKFIISVRAKNPAGALQLSYQKMEIQNKINNYFGYDAVSKIQVKK